MQAATCVRPTRHRVFAAALRRGVLRTTSVKLSDPHWNERPLEEQQHLTAKRQLDFLVESAKRASKDSDPQIDYDTLWKDFSAAEFAPNTLSRVKDDMLERTVRERYNPAALGFEEESENNNMDVIVNRINRRMATGGASDVSDELFRYEKTAARRDKLDAEGVFEAAPTADIAERLRRATIRRGYEGSAKEPLTPLGASLLDQMDASGPMSLAVFMHSCALDGGDGFYATKTPFGATGSFTTSPESSSLFGWAIARWLLLSYQALGSPPRVDVMELGPGTGKLARDVITHLRSIAGGRALLDAASFHLVDASAGLRAAQQETLADVTDTSIAWHMAPDGVFASPARRPLLCYSNEFFDALPVRHFVNNDGVWSEVHVAVNSALDRPLHFGLTWGSQPTPIGRLFEAIFCRSHMPNAPEYRALRSGAAVEWCPKGMLAFHDLATAIAQRRGALIAVDYGCLAFPRPQHPDVGYSCSDAERGAPSLTTLRGIRDHKVVPFLSSPGATDLTADVNFDHLRSVLVLNKGAGATLGGKVVCPQAITQGEFLTRLGIEGDVTAALRLTSSRGLVRGRLGGIRMGRCLWVWVWVWVCAVCVSSLSQSISPTVYSLFFLHRTTTG